MKSGHGQRGSISNAADMTYLSAMRPEDILMPTPAGCAASSAVSNRSTRPVEQGADHARPFRPCARRPRRGAGDAGDARPDAAALRREFRRLDAGDRHTAKRVRLGGARSSFHPAGHVLGSAQICVEAKGTAHRRLGRLQGRRRSDLRAVRARALRRLHHRSDLRAAGVPPRRRRTARSPSSCVRSRCFPSARISSAPIRSARRSA